MTVRMPKEAGRFYPANKEDALLELEQYFNIARDKVSDKRENILGLILPHAGWVFSGIVTAAGVYRLDPQREYKNIFLLGASHRFRLSYPSVWTGGNFKTPLGEVKISDKVKNLTDSKIFVEDLKPHIEEHSLEVIIPFLQYHLKKEFFIVPVLFDAADYETPFKAAVELSSFVGKDDLVIVSSDFSHYPSYKDAIKTDKKTLDLILEGDSYKLIEEIEKMLSDTPGLDTCACGLAAILCLVEFAKKKNAKVNGVLYMNSGDSGISGKNSVVGYHAIEFKI